MNNYFEQKEILWENYIKKAVNDMIATGLDLVSDGQIKDPFIQLFTRHLKGCRIRDRTEIIDKIEYQYPITVDDQKYVKSLLPKSKGIIGVLTGPYTLAKSCIDLFYDNEKELTFDFAYALKKEAKKLQQYVDIISIDEPFFSNEMPYYAKELIQIITNNLSCPTRLHVCGDVSKIIDKIVEIPVDILSHEFKAKPNLLEEFKNYDFSQKLCLGAVRSDNTTIESVEEIKEHIDKALKLFDEKIIQVSPDCGQRLLPRDVAVQKLKNLVQAGEKIHGRERSTVN
jgi:5-methyltetrahydropteroyltriglutamate--homocysteine methyltransferase